MDKEFYKYNRYYIYIWYIFFKIWNLCTSNTGQTYTCINLDAKEIVRLLLDIINIINGCKKNFKSIDY